MSRNQLSANVLLTSTGPKHKVPTYLHRSFVCFGHRGACGYAPENTLRAFDLAIQQGVDGIELDVQQVDDELLVFHDKTLNRTTNGVGWITDFPVSVLRTLDAGDGERIPLLGEVLTLVNQRVCVNIEIKDHQSAEAVASLVTDCVQQHHWPYEALLISSFDFDQLRRVHNANPAIPLGVLCENNLDEALVFAEEHAAFSMHPSLTCVNESFVEQAHGAGFKVYVFTVNELADVARMIAWGVDGVFSDVPDRVLAHLPFMPS